MRRAGGPVLRADNWFARNAFVISRTMEVFFGLVWGADAILKYQPAFLDQFSSLVSGAADGQPSWLAGWFSFWTNATASNPAFFAYVIAILETLLAVSLVLGFARKIGYGGGFLLSLTIWTVPEGFGGPYGPSSTDIGTGIIYAFVFVFLAVISSLYGPNKYTVDYFIEKKFDIWRSIAEIKRE